MHDKSYKRPESVLVVVYTRQGQFLMLERTQPRGFWQSVTGSLKWHETPAKAAARELFEETGLRADGKLIDLHHQQKFPIIYPWRERYAPHHHYNKEHWFALPLAGKRTIDLQSDEHRQFRWMSAHEAARRAFSWTNRKLIQGLGSMHA